MRSSMTTYVAKIFDGMDYQLPTEEDLWAEGDPGADHNYTVEVRAYETMQKYAADIQDLRVPRYYGSWTLKLPIENNRPVRLILLEEIKGESLYMITDKSIGNKTPLPSDAESLKTLAQIVEAKAHIDWAGVRHRDLAFRNIILTPEGEIKIFDFDRANIWAENERIAGVFQHAWGWPKSLPRSPIESLWVKPGWGDGSPFLKWTGWIPASWVHMEEDEADINEVIDAEKANEWLATTFKNSPKFQPPSPKFMKATYHEEESAKLQSLIGYKKEDS